MDSCIKACLCVIIYQYFYLDCLYVSLALISFIKNLMVELCVGWYMGMCMGLREYDIMWNQPCILLWARTCISLKDGTFCFKMKLLPIPGIPLGHLCLA